MDKLIIVILCFYFGIALCAAPENLGECATKMRECSTKLDTNKDGEPSIRSIGEGRNGRRAVCGSDNQTYSTKCHLERAQCQGHPVTLKYRGQCKDACIVSRNYALEHQKSKRQGYGFSFVPRCRSDGRYAPVQCLEGTGCWCVTPKGTAIPNTSVRSGRPICARKGKSNTRRRSSTGGRGKKNKKGCNRAEKAAFNANLIRIFRTEYLRANPSASQTNPQTPEAQQSEDRAVLDWKFNAMDKNNDHMLDKSEYRELKRLVKKIVKPKRCAKTFGRACDLIKDERLSRHEWGNCLARDGMDQVTGGSTSAGHRGPNGMGLTESDEDDMDDEEEEDESEDDRSHGEPGVIRGTRYNIQKTKPALLLYGSGNPMGVHKGSVDNPGGRGREDPEYDCLSDRASVLDEPVAGAEAHYVPECTPDGRYKRVQCYISTGYCWCVHEDTGTPIPGTSAKDLKPQCDALPTPSRPMKGCSEEKKAVFLKDLMEFLRKQMAAATNGTNISGWMQPQDEKVATWHFVMLDKNINKALDRREWKTFRALISNSRLLRRCGKKLPRYCDANNDRRITLAEWLNCLQAQRSTQENSEAKPTVQTKRRGPNPLESYLKSD